jgi:hypothetical protein
LSQQIDGAAVRRWLTRLALAAAIIVLALQLQRLTPAFAAATDDFVQYWTAARLLLAGDNPYDPAAMLPIQQEAGRPRDYALLMYNPPWTLTAVLWTAFLDYPTARAVWLLVSLASIVVSADLLWRLYGNPEQKRWLAWTLGLTFMPALLALDMGQIGPFILLGLTGFLYFSQQNRWFMAGACLTLVAIKPQLLYLVWVALLFWVIKERRWVLLLGGAAASALAMALPLLLNPTVIGDYIYLTRAYPPFTIWAPPTWGTVLRLWFGVEHVWLQTLPVVLGLAWFLYHWRRHHNRWDWSQQLPALLLVSLLTTPYGWLHDQVVLIVAVICAAGWVRQNWPQWSVLIVVLLYGLTNLLIFLFQLISFAGIIEVWTTIAWLIPYTLVKRNE